ncbi:MAG: AsmA-like C-terminal region-containing protein [Bacteroidales bacterium]
MKNKKSKLVFKRIFTYSIGITGGILALLSGIIALTLHTVLSPEKLTPLVINQAQPFIKSQIAASSIELTFFSSFPEFKLHIKDGYIGAPHDTLIRFEEIAVGISPLKFLTKKEIHIDEIAVRQANIKAIINKNGTPNWDITKTDSTNQTADTTQSKPLAIESLKIKQIVFENVDLHFTDSVNLVQFDLASFNASLSGDFGKINNELDVKLHTNNIRFEQEGKILANHIELGVESHVELNIPAHTLRTDKMAIELNGIKAGCAGSIQKDTLLNEYNMNIHWGLNIPSLADVLKLIPKSIVKEVENVNTTGDILVTGTLKGTYGNGIFPIADLKAAINNGSFHYKGMQYGVDLLDLNANGHINLNQKENSVLNITNFKFKGASSEIQLSGSVKKLLTDPFIDAQLNTNIDFTSLAKSFPLENEVRMEGIIESKLKGKFAISSIAKRDFGKLGLDGYLKISDIKLESPADSFFVNIESAGLAFGTNKTNKDIIQNVNLLNAIVGFDGLDVNTRMGVAKMDSVRMQVKSSPLKDTTAIVNMEASIAMKHLTGITKDSIGIHSGKSKIAFKIKPSHKNKLIPVIESTLQFDSISLNTPTEHVTMYKAGFILKSEKGNEYKKQWISEGKIGFGALKAWTSTLPLPISMPHSALVLQKDELVLENAGIRIGDSDMRLTGKFSNLKKAFHENGILKGDYTLTSSFIDCNQLIQALKITETDSKETVQPIDKANEHPADSIAVFVVPDKIDFTMHTKVDKVQLGHMTIENINGDIVMRNQAIELEGLKMHTLAADMISTLVYRAKDASSAYTGFDVRMKDIQVGKLVELMPALDTLVPMLRSLDGIVNFHVAAETNLNSDMSPIISSIQAAANLRGDSLVLMDGQTFTEISKMLRFKNKERNVIDSISVDMIVRNGQIEIYPFRITMDRYMAAVGGKHNLDMSFNYHVSLLQSPIPFKVGVDVKGNMDDFKFRLTKPKYKDIHQITRTSPVDSTSTTLRQRIKRVLQKAE